MPPDTSSQEPFERLYWEAFKLYIAVHRGIFYFFQATCKTVSLQKVRMQLRMHTMP